jgi:hypothetical protein
MSKHSTFPLVPAAPQASRRALLFGIAAAGFVASPAVASSLLGGATAPSAETLLDGLAPAMASPSGPDPIFALITEHRAAVTAYAQAWDRASKLRDDEEELWEPAKILIGEYPESKTEVIISTDDELHVRHVRTGKMMPITTHLRRDIKQNTPKGLTKSQRAYWIRKKTAELKRAEEARDALRDASASGIAWDAMNAASSYLYQLTDQFVDAKPRTIGGAVVLLKYWTEFARDYDEEFADQTPEVMSNIAAALAKIEGARS